MNIALQEEVMLPQLFDALPEPVILFKPRTDESGAVLDFEIAYCNNAAGKLLDAPKNLIIGQTVLTATVINEKHKTALLKQCQKVWETGKPRELSLYEDKFGRDLTILKRRTTEGVLSVARDKTELLKVEKGLQKQLSQFTAVLDASGDGVMILEAVRNNAGEVADFKLTRCNKAGFELAKIPMAAIGKTLLEILPHLKDSEQFELHKKVLETGHPEKIETTFRNDKGEEYGWFIVSLMKMGESVVSTFIDISQKKTNEQKIEEQAELLKGIFDASINAIFACEAIRNVEAEIVDLKILKINKSFTNVLGLSAEAVEGRLYNSVFPAAKKAGFFGHYCRVIQTGENFRGEIFYDAENMRGWYDVSAVKRGANGIVITFTNITESRQNKRALEEGAHYLQDIIDSTQTGIMLLSPVKDERGEIKDFRFKTVNLTLAKVAGRQPSDLIGTLYSHAFAATVSNGIFEKYKEVAEGKVPETRFEQQYTGDGIEAWIDVMAKKRGDDLLIAFHDFTPLKKLQEEIARSAEKLTTVINNSPAGMFTIEPVFNRSHEIEDFRFVIVNQAVAAYIEETAGNLAGSLATIYFPAYKTNGLFEIYKDTYQNDQQHRFDFHYEDGYDVYFHIHTVRAGQEVLVTFTDHTALKKLQVELETSIEELKKSNAGLEEFAYAASHDLQEPLRKINYFAERLRKGLGQRLSEDENRMFERMENAARRMSQLINDLLTYSQISRNKRTFGTTNLNEVLQQVTSDLETAIAEKKAAISIPRLPVIHGDPVQLRQLFQNLLSNSLKYSKQDTPPAISVNCNEVTRQINGVSKSFYSIQIVDNGIGFEQEHAERIFKVFQRLHGQSEFPGTGIGLAIVQKVVENHHGIITAAGRPGEGSTFTILLPAD